MRGAETDGGPAADLSTPEDLRVHGEPSLVKHPIFVVGCPRSGTTILRWCLDSHPRISAGPEESALYCLSKADNTKARERREGYGVDEEDWYEMVRGLVEGLMRPYAESQGKTRWALKHPELCFSIPFLNKIYPECQVIHIVRDPSDVVASCARLFGRSLTQRYGRLWTQSVRAAERDGPKLGPNRFKTIRYEDLVAEPEKQLRDVIEWLGEPWSEEALWVHARTHRFPAERNPKAALQQRVALHTRSVGGGQKKANLLALLYLKAKAGDLTGRFGYRVNPMTTRI
jgi:hypothetical protein